jgi:hypothetical protein
VQLLNAFINDIIAFEEGRCNILMGRRFENRWNLGVTIWGII